MDKGWCVDVECSCCKGIPKDFPSVIFKRKQEAAKYAKQAENEGHVADMYAWEK